MNKHLRLHLAIPEPEHCRVFLERFLFNLTIEGRVVCADSKDPQISLETFKWLNEVQHRAWNAHFNDDRADLGSLVETLRAIVAEHPPLAGPLASAWQSALDALRSRISSPLKLYTRLAPWWPLLSPVSDYQEEAGFYRQMLIDACEGQAKTLLELGSGGGNNASFMKKSFEEVMLVDLSLSMIKQSQALNPQCEHHQGDMRSVRLNRLFDVVFVHDAVMHMTTEADLRSAMETAFVHCRPGGAALFTPDFVRETFVPSTEHGGDDGSERGMRYLSWAWDPDPADDSYRVDYAYLLKHPDGTVRVEHDHCIEGLFPKADWLRWLEESGFKANSRPVIHTGLEDQEYLAFIGQKPIAD